MKYEQYIAQRNDLMNQARTAVENGNTEEFNSIREKITALDNQYEAAQINQANLRALQDNAITPPAMQQLMTPASAPAGTQNLTEDPYASEAYSQAFMNFVCRGTAIPAEFRNQSTSTADVGALIPTTILKEIVKNLREHGMIFQSLRQLNVQGGVEIPIVDLKPEAHWINEAKSSDDQKITANTSVKFSYYGLECKIARSILVNVVTLEAFQSLFVELATEAVIVAVEKGVFKGTGSGQMLGVCNDTRVTNVITLADAEFTSWESWKKKVIAKIPKSYRHGNWYMAQGTFDGYIDGMVDKQGQPIGRTNYGISEDTPYRFSGRPVETVEDDVLTPYETASADEVVAVYMNPKDYVFNSNMQLNVVEWIDHDSNEKKTKVIMICDGKIADPNGVVLVKKHA